MDPLSSTIQSLKHLNTTQMPSFALSGFEVERFRQLFGLVESALAVPKHGRKHVIGPMDGFFLFLHWLRSANPIAEIAVRFQLRSPTLYKPLHKVG
jgi:hypothetical protein